MGLRKRAEVFRSRLTRTHVRIAVFLGIAIWIAFLRLYPGSLLIAFSMPFGIALICMGPLELIPDHWYRINFFVNTMMSLFFQGSVMFLGVALSFELPWSKDARLGFVLCWFALQTIIYSWARRRMLLSHARKQNVR
ncbi:hypothetical protein D3C77_255040 [compost metagenome]